MRKKLIGMMRPMAIVSCVLAAGCAGTNTSAPSPDASMHVDPPVVSLSSIPPVSFASSAVSTPPVPAQPEAKREAQTATQPVPAAPTAAKAPTVPKDASAKVQPSPHAGRRSETQSTTGGTGKSAAPPKADAKIGAEKPAAAEPIKIAPPPPAARVAEPTLDVTDLKTRLRETPAIGTFTKLALKNQMDDLVDRFRAVYQSGQRTGVAALRQPFDALVVKVLTQLRPGDPTLARSIESSREALWGILADPEKFKSIT